MKRICLLLLFVTSACISTMPPAMAKKVTVSISGSIHHPARRIPAMQICAVNMGSNKKTCVKTKGDYQVYKISKLPAGEYQIRAFAGSYPNNGGYMQQVQCIQAPCDPVPGNISLAAGESFEKADISFQMPGPPSSNVRKN
jgi:hypothetical protein